MKAESKGREAYVERNANERVYALLEVLAVVARRRETNAARVALAWLCSRPGVSSPILGVRTLAQLQDNLAALELRLDAPDIAELDAASTPTLNFPAEFHKVAMVQSYAGLTINGQTFAPAFR
jgi:aryl-alcohol dehydrogenase-like predicted oxidoreductase